MLSTRQELSRASSQSFDCLEYVAGSCRPSRLPTMEPLPEPAMPMKYARTNGGNAAFHNFNNDYSHISDPNLRRRLALAEIDKVRRRTDRAQKSSTDPPRYRSDGITYGPLQLLVSVSSQTRTTSSLSISSHLYWEWCSGKDRLYQDQIWAETSGYCPKQ